MKSTAAIGGHPIHPMLVPVPVGLFVWALVANIVFLLSDNDRTWYDISCWSSIAGIAGALVAGAFGALDGFTVARESDARGSAMAHMVLNVVVTGLFLSAVLLMWDGNAIEGSNGAMATALQAVGVGLLALSGWIGGEMVYRHHLGMIPDDREVAEDQERRRGRFEAGRPATRPR